jgi:hypothetical protein
MASMARGGRRSWEPFGVTDADFAAAPKRDGIKVVNVTPRAGGPGQAGWWLLGAACALAVLAVAAAVVSWDAQFAMVAAVKTGAGRVVAALEAGIPDAGAVVFAALGVALALHGKRALRPRALNAACIGISLVMNALASAPGWRDLAIWVMPSAVYALASDTLIGVIRAWVLARARNTGETLADDGPTPLALVGGLALWLLRLALAPGSTLTGFRAWVVTDCPVAPGTRPGHVAALAAVRRETDQRIALAAAQQHEAAEYAAAEVRQAREDAARAQGAEQAARAALEQARAQAERDLEALRVWSAQQIGGLRGEIQQGREDAAQLLGEIQNAAAARVAALDEARAELRARAEQAQGEAAACRADRDRLAAQLQAAAGQPKPRMARPARTWARDRAAARGGPTKRDRMIALAAGRHDLAALPLEQVSGVANELAAEIGYSAGTARRELLSHVRHLQGAPGSGALAVSNATEMTEGTRNDG